MKNTLFCALHIVILFARIVRMNFIGQRLDIFPLFVQVYLKIRYSCFRIEMFLNLRCRKVYHIKTWPESDPSSYTVLYTKGLPTGYIQKDITRLPVFHWDMRSESLPNGYG